MSGYQLDRFTVLFAEDNAFVAQVLSDLLRNFRIERISHVKNGEEAINYLKDMKRVGNPGPDILISDLVMSPINGLLLLRWVRTSKDSPNRFMPFVMLSGAADYDYVNSSRDLGVTEFLAKPFSATSVYNHIGQVIEFPRPFIATQKYFGPDRRRIKDAGPPGVEERRRDGDGHITDVYSADKVQKAKNASEVWRFHLPNSLKDKAGGGKGGVPPIPDDILEQAEESLERASLDFADWAMEYLGNLAKLCEEAMEHPERRGAQFAKINELAHELRGQGGTFGYTLISIFGKMLFEATREGCPETDNQVEIVRAHVDAMRAVIREKVAGDGGDVGKALLASLKSAIAKHQVVE